MGRIDFNFNLYKKALDLFNSYPICDPKIFIKDNDLYMSLSFKLPAPILIENTCLGIDLGIKRFFTTSEGNAFSDKKFLKEKRRVRYQKRMLASKKHKSHSARTKLKKIRHKEQNKTKEMCYKATNLVLKTESNIIVIEDLSKIKSKNKGKRFNNKLAQVPFYQFKQILTYKALLKGKRVVTVNPYMTSQNDYRDIKKGRRTGCRYYASDKKVFDADWNASINIAQKSSCFSKLPVLFSAPLDGALNFIGRTPSTVQS